MNSYFIGQEIRNEQGSDVTEMCDVNVNTDVKLKANELNRNSESGRTVKLSVIDKDNKVDTVSDLESLTRERFTKTICLCKDLP